jgi:hypothetical protein
MFIVFETAGLFVTQVILELTEQVTWSPFDGLYENTGLFIPAFTPFTFHWKTGEKPPFTTVAV